MGAPTEKKLWNQEDFTARWEKVSQHSFIISTMTSAIQTHIAPKQLDSSRARKTKEVKIELHAKPCPIILSSSSYLERIFCLNSRESGFLCLSLLYAKQIIILFHDCDKLCSTSFQSSHWNASILIAKRFVRDWNGGITAAWAWLVSDILVLFCKKTIYAPFECHDSDAAEAPYVFWEYRWRMTPLFLPSPLLPQGRPIAMK